MATPYSSFVIKRNESFGGSFVDSVHLGHAYETGKPYVFENQITKIFSSESDLFAAKLLVNMTGDKMGGVKEIDNEVYRWFLQGAEEKLARVVETLDDSNTTPGLNLTPFKVKLDLNYFHSPDVLMGSDPEYPVAVVEGPIPDGNGYIYTLKLQGDNYSTFFPVADLEPGKEFSKVWTSTVSELNSEYGTQQYPNSFQLEHQVGAFAQKVTITDKAWRDEGKIDIKFLYTVDGKTKTADRFLPMAEAYMWDNLYKGMEAQMIYGKKQTQPGSNGYWKKTGAGLRQQMKDSWLHFFTGSLSISELKDFLLDIYAPRKDEGMRKTVGMTGTVGSQMFHDALVAISNGYLTLDTHFINKIASPVDTPHLAYGAQYTRYNGPHGITVDLMVNRMYDSRDYCKRMHPQYPNFPIDSARIDFLDFGSSKGESNIQMLKVKDTYKYGHVDGTWTPTGPVKGGSANSLIDGYTLFTAGTMGLKITDITKLGAFVYDVEF